MKKALALSITALALIVGTMTTAGPANAQSLGHVIKDAFVGHDPWEYNVGYPGYGGHYNSYVVPRVNTYSSVISPYYSNPYAGYYNPYGYVRPKSTVHRVIDSFLPYHFD